MNIILKQIISKTTWNLIGYGLESLIEKAKAKAEEIKKENESKN